MEVRETISTTVLGARGDTPRGEEELSVLQRHEVVGEHRGAEKDVIVEVDEVLRERVDVVEIELDGGRRERGKCRLVAEDFRVRNHLHSRVGAIQPGGNLAVCDDEDVADPGSISLQRTKTVPAMKHTQEANLSSSLSRNRLSEVAESTVSSDVMLYSLLYRPL